MTDRPWRLTALAPLPVEAVRLFVPDLPIDVTVPTDRTPDGVLAAVSDADLILGDYTGQLRVDAGVVAAASRLAFVQQPTVGVETLDLAALADAGVPAANTAGANAVAVAEWCVLGALAACRQVAWADAAVRAGEWPQLDVAARGCVDLAGRRVGLLGLGPIGAAAATRFAAFGCEVSYWSRRERPVSESAGATFRPLRDLLATSDVLVVVIALTAATAGLVDRTALSSLPQGAVVVNAARGGIVDEEALVDLLDSGHLLGAALDVYATEPLSQDSRLRTHDRVLLSPHVAGATLQSRLRIVEMVTANLRRAVSGAPVEDVVNDVDPVVRRRSTEELS